MIIFHGRTQELGCTVVSNGTMNVINQWGYKLQVIHVIHIYGPHSLWGLRITSSNLPKPQLICHRESIELHRNNWLQASTLYSWETQSGDSIAHPALPKLIGSRLDIISIAIFDWHTLCWWWLGMLYDRVSYSAAYIAVAFACNFQRFVRWLSSWTMHRSQKASEL